MNVGLEEIVRTTYLHRRDKLLDRLDIETAVEAVDVCSEYEAEIRECFASAWIDLGHNDNAVVRRMFDIFMSVEDGFDLRKTMTGTWRRK